MADQNQQTAQVIDPQIQTELNKPLVDPEGMKKEDKDFLEMVIKLINEGKINLYNPETLINNTVYATLTTEVQAKVDMEAFNLLSALRDMKGLHDSDNSETYQMENLVQRVRLSKERLEKEGGDLFII
ncbi:hypothetical protein HY604_04915 [Candidatus Peregrinibacteria bacterium]|nr:hypothetical protein [Candidatus Peregrinibacteria bacterium]